MENINVTFEGTNYEVEVDDTIATIYIPSEHDLDEQDIKEIVDTFEDYASRWYKSVFHVIVERNHRDVFKLVEEIKLEEEELTSPGEDTEEV